MLDLNTFEPILSFVKEPQAMAVEVCNQRCSWSARLLTLKLLNIILEFAFSGMCNRLLPFTTFFPRSVMHPRQYDFLDSKAIR